LGLVKVESFGISTGLHSTPIVGSSVLSLNGIDKMKKILSILIVIQLIGLSFYGMLYFRGEGTYRLLHHNIIELMINFNEEIDGFNFLVNTMDDHDIEVSRILWLDEERIAIHTTDLTLGNTISLQYGAMPTEETNEFISTESTGEDSQTGLFHSPIPGTSISIHHITSPSNFGLDGIYYLHTSNVDLIYSLLPILETEIFYVELWWVHQENISLFNILFSGFNSLVHFGEFIGLTIIAFLCVIGAIIWYVVVKIKSASIFSIYGYSRIKVSYIISVEFTKLFLLSMSIAYFITLFFAFINSFSSFIINITTSFFFICIFLFIFYLIGLNVVLQCSLGLRSRLFAIKGKRKVRGLFTYQLTLKVVCLFAMMLIGSTFISELHTLQVKHNNRVHWEVSRNVHRLLSSWVGQNDSDISYVLHQRNARLFDALSESHNAFIMYSENIFFRDSKYDLGPYYDMENAPPMELSPHGFRLDISPNFFNFNPISTVNGIDIHEQIIWDDHVMNIIVPEHLMTYEEDIIELYLENFYFLKVEIENGYYWPEIVNTLTIEELDINIIVADSNQYYFSFDHSIRSTSGSRILDPIAVIYTGSIHPSTLSAWFSNSLYFYSSAVNAYDDIFPMIYEQNLESAIQRTSPIYDHYSRLINNSIEQIFRLVILNLLLLLAIFGITYYTVANYFEAKKFELVVKRNHGYHVLKRNKTLVLSLIGFSFPTVLVASYFLGWLSLLIGLAILVLDIIVVMSFERSLMKKTFAEIIKGER